MNKLYFVAGLLFFIVGSSVFAQVNCGTYHCCPGGSASNEPCGSLCSDGDGNSQSGKACPKGTCTSTASGGTCIVGKTSVITKDPVNTSTSKAKTNSTN